MNIYVTIYQRLMSKLDPEPEVHVMYWLALLAELADQKL